MLHDFKACCWESERFIADYPNGFDIGGLWGSDEEAASVWHALFTSEWKYRIGWAISVGLLPARIRADLRGANLQEAGLWGANLHRANLCKANLREANLWKANLRGANLRGADLWKANLRGANLRKADLRGANLRGARLCGANLCRADLRGVNLCEANLGEAHWDEDTQWPDGFTPEEK